jgi:hypothetical protein
MANAWYPFGKAEVARGNIDLLADDIRVIFIDTGDETYNAADQDIADIAAGAMVGAGGGNAGSDGVALASKTISDTAVFDAADTTITSVTGDEFEACLIYKWTGTAGTSTLIMWIDTGTGMTQPPDGGNVNITWNGSGIGQL